MDSNEVEQNDVYRIGNDYFFILGFSDNHMHMAQVNKGQIFIPNLCVEKENIESQSGTKTSLSLSEIPSISEETIDTIRRIQTAVENEDPEAIPDQ